MDSKPSDDSSLHLYAQLVKVVIVGPFGVGKTTFVTTMSEVTPLRTEEPMTQDSVGVDDLRGKPEKTTTTVGLDWGRVTLDEDLVLFLFGAPGQQRFQHVWEDIAHGALGALVLADTRSLELSFQSLTLVEGMGLPYAVAINTFDGAPLHSEADLRTALDLDHATPLVFCDARVKNEATHALITLLQYLLPSDALEPA